MQCAAPFSCHAFSSRVFPTHNRIVSPLILIMIVIFVYLEHISQLIFYITYVVYSCDLYLELVLTVNMKQNIYRRLSSCSLRNHLPHLPMIYLAQEIRCFLMLISPFLRALSIPRPYIDCIDSLQIVN